MRRYYQGYSGIPLADDPAVSTQDDVKLQVTQDQMPVVTDTGPDAVHDQTLALKRAVVEEAAKSAAISTGLSVAAIATSETPIGWVLLIIAALLALIKLFTGPYVKKQIKGIIDNAVKELGDYAKAKQVEMIARSLQVTDSEWTAAQQLALSDQPLGSFFDKIGKDITVALRTVAKPIAKPLVKVHAAPLKFIGDQTIKSWVMVAKILGQEKTAEKLQHFDGEWKQHMDHATAQAEAMLADPVMGVRVMHAYPFRLITGLSQEDQVRKRARELVIQGKRQIDVNFAKVMTALGAPTYRNSVRAALAKAIRANPQLLGEAQVAINPSGASNVPAPAPASGSGGLLSIVALVGGYFWLNK